LIFRQQRHRAVHRHSVRVGRLDLARNSENNAASPM